MPRSTASCPMCPKIVAVKFNTERLIVHDTPEGVECAGSELLPPQVEPAAAVEWKPSKKRKQAGKNVAAESGREPTVPASPPRSRPKSANKGGSVWTISGGLPGLGKRR